MDAEIFFGIIVIFLSLVLIVALVLWSRRRIERIARTGPRSAREILKDSRRG